MRGLMDRQQFLTWLAEGAAADGLPGDGPRPKAGMLLVLRPSGLRSSDQSPVIVLATPEEVEDFFAFVVIYVSTYSPFSAFFKVLSFDEWEQAREIAPLPSPLFIRSLVGAVICDSAVVSRAGSFESITLRDCLVSEAHSLACAVVAGRRKDVPRASARWRACTRVLSGSEVDERSLGAFWSAVAEVSSPQSLLSDSFLPAARVSRILLIEEGFSDRFWFHLKNEFPQVANIQNDMVGPREARARAFTSFIRSPFIDELGSDADFVVGLLGAMLGGGQIEYVSLIGGLREVFPDAPRWFGFVCGCVGAGDVLTASRSLGRHVLQEMTLIGTGSGIPCADIAYAELRVLARAKPQKDWIRSKSEDVARVEILPGLVVPVATRSARIEPEAYKSSAESKVILDAKRLAAQLLALLDGAEREPDLFPPPSGKRKGTAKRKFY